MAEFDFLGMSTNVGGQGPLSRNAPPFLWAGLGVDTKWVERPETARYCGKRVDPVLGQVGSSGPLLAGHRGGRRTQSLIGLPPPNFPFPSWTLPDPDGAAAAGGTEPGGLPASFPEGPCPGPPEADPGRETTGSTEASGTLCPAGSHYCCCRCCRHRHGSPQTLPCCCRPAHWGRPGTTSSRTPEPAPLGLPPSAPTEGLPRVPFWPSPSAEPSTLSA